MRSEPETSISDGLPSWDIFCAVVDNYGDIGVCWRLARQLAAEYGFHVRLWLDDLASLHKLCPDLDPSREEQRLCGVEIRHWRKDFQAIQPADVVVEAFACQLPAIYIEAMARQRPVWINLEYLSAEPWVKTCHGMASPHASLPLTKYFFFPGFEPGTGGLLAEQGLQEQRRHFLASLTEQEALWRIIDMEPPRDGELRVSLFCYESAPVKELLTIWAAESMPLTCLIPAGVATETLVSFFGQDGVIAGTTLKKGSLTVRIYGFLEQRLYDKLLWACHLNFVRGEDSFVRAQWAARPIVWQIYPQEENAHHPKLAAFMNNYRDGLGEPAARAFVALTEAWNRGSVTAPDWQEFRKHLPELAEQATRRTEKLLQLGDLTRNLVNFCKNRIQ